MSRVVALVVPVEAAPHRAEISAAHADLCALVGDVNTDTVFFADDTGMVKVAANGKALATHRPNPTATRIVERFMPGFAARDRVEGPAVFLGLTQDGEVTDVAEQVVAFAARVHPAGSGSTS